MLFEKKAPFYLKLFTSIDGYIHIFLAPIIIFLISKDIRLSGLYFMIEGVFRFLSYLIAGNICEILNIRKLIRIAYLIRFLFILNAILIYLYYPYKYVFLLINNLGFIAFNCLTVTSFEILYQKNYNYNQKIQSQISSGDMLAAGLAISSILVLFYFKINLGYYLIILPATFIIGYRFLFVKTKRTMSFKRNKKVTLLLSEIKNNFGELFSVVKNDKTFVFDTMIGYFPFMMLIMIEQFYIYELSAIYNDNKMKIVHYSIKMIAFLSSSFFIPWAISKVKEIKTTLIFSLILYFFGIFLSIQPDILSFRILGLIFIAYSHYFVFNYRKMKRRDTMIKNKLSFHVLGLFFALEGLGTIMANMLLTFFGKSYKMIIISSFIFFCIMILYTMKQYHFFNWVRFKINKKA